MRRHIRYFILLLILAFVAVNEAVVRMRTASWERPLEVHIYAISGDNRQASRDYVNRLTIANFKPIERFVNREAEHYGLNMEAIEVTYHGRLDSHPPQPPESGNMLQNMWWSMRFRSWVWKRNWTSDNDAADVELFVNYFDTETSHRLRHSVGLRGGLIGIINAFADKSYRGSNHVVITHELMHTLGATDKYDLATVLPQHPQGYADPYQQPLYPQRKAEIMGGRIPLSSSDATMPDALGKVVVGVFTAAEIGWSDAGP